MITSKLVALIFRDETENVKHMGITELNKPLLIQILSNVKKGGIGGMVFTWTTY